MEQLGNASRMLQATTATVPDYMLINPTVNNMGWKIVDDQVMGGKSQSYFVQQENDYDKFFGTLSTDGGGFCIAQTNKFVKPFDLSKYQGIALDVRSEKELTYKLGLTDRSGFAVVNWAATFDVPATPAGSKTWTRIEVPFSEFIPTFLGQLTQAGKMDLTNVKDLSIWYTMYDHIVGDFTTGYLVKVDKYADGPFELQFKDIKAYGVGDAASRDKK